MFTWPERYIRLLDLAYELGLTEKKPEVKLIDSKNITEIQPTTKPMARRFYIQQIQKEESKCPK